MPLLLSAFGLSLAAAGTGVGLMIASTDRGADADDLLRRLVDAEVDGKCPCGTDAQRAELVGLRRDHDLFFNVATGMFIGAGVLAVGGAVYALTPSFQRPRTKPSGRAAPPASASLVPVVSEQGGGALLIGTF